MRLRRLLCGSTATCLLTACASAPTSPPASTEKAPTSASAPAATAPEVLKLTPYQTAGHRTVEASVGGQTLPFIFDTGGGITLITPELAAAAGCEPVGRLVGYRMRGDRVDFARCDDVDLVAPGATLRDRTVGVFDINALLPPEWPALGGLITLSSVEGQHVRLDLGGGAVEVRPPPPLPDAAAKQLNVVRQASGFSIVVLIPSPTATGELWLELDTGSSAPLLLAPHAAQMLGVETVDQDDGRKTFTSATIALPGVGPVQTSGGVVDMIYDGNIGAPLIERFIWELDLAHDTVVVHER
jgi:hypothetical protein